MNLKRATWVGVFFLFAAIVTACGGGSSDNGDDDGGGGGSAGGCGTDPGQPLQQWLERSVSAAGSTRTYFVWLPANYDPNRSYPVVYQFHGCSVDRETNNVPVESQSGDDAIHVRGRAINQCWDESETGTGVALFDAMAPQIESEFCVDTSRRFVTGYSSGAFVAHALACVRGDMLRGVATVAGGYWGSIAGCSESVAALQIHDQDDTSVDISFGEVIRDSYLGRNSCDTSATTTPTSHPPCEAYSGCANGYPVIWCETSGQGHSRQDSLAAPAFWDFISTF